MTTNPTATLCTATHLETVDFSHTPQLCEPGPRAKTAIYRLANIIKVGLVRGFASKENFSLDGGRIKDQLLSLEKFER